MAEIATLKKINLRDVWKDEGQFSDWLAENLSRLGDELGMALERSEREKAVGPFSADIICADQISKFDVVIENQFTRTDHDNLGKMITYASGLQYQIIIWVAPRFRDEHRSAIDWFMIYRVRKPDSLVLFLKSFKSVIQPMRLTLILSPGRMTGSDR